LDGGPERTLEEVGEHFKVTRERVRQIQNLALSKLRKMIEKMESVQK
jgi:RNA polymerase primary sigma factor